MADKDGPAATEPGYVNWDLIHQLSLKPHKHLNVGTCQEYTCEHGHDHLGHGEVMFEARTVQHLCDLAGIPAGRGYSAHIDARVFQMMAELVKVREQVARIADWHSRESGPAGTVGDYCVECAHRWPCPTRRLADGENVDENPAVT